MLNKANSAILQNAVLERIKKVYPEADGIEGFPALIAKIAAAVAVATLQEYEKINQANSSDD